MSKKCPRCKQRSNVNLFFKGLCPACTLAVYGKLSERQIRMINKIKENQVSEYRKMHKASDLINPRLIRLIRSLP